MKELPKVYVNPIDKKLKNNKDMFYSRLLEEKKDTRSIMNDIDRIFHSRDFVYKSKVEIVMENGVIEAVIVGKSGSSLLTMEGKSIPIASIKEIKKIT